jgi:hypothetical protein
MMLRSFVCARTKADASGEAKPDAKDTLSSTHTTTRDAHVRNVVGELLSRLRTGIVVTAAKDRSVWTPRPPVG